MGFLRTLQNTSRNSASYAPSGLPQIALAAQIRQHFRKFQENCAKVTQKGNAISRYDKLE
jgi:hypothetical protein